MKSRSRKIPILNRLIDGLVRVHHDQRGTISLASVFALILLTMLLGMLMNSVRQVNQKVQMQNAADAATYAGGVVAARNMNTLAFTNHLLSDVFAITAFTRESYYRNAESFTPEVIDHWDRIAPHLQKSKYESFAELGFAIEGKTPLEGDKDLVTNSGDMVSTWSDWHYAIAEPVLPVMETILYDYMIPNFQTALVLNTPVIAQAAADEVAGRHGDSWPQRTELRAVLWTTYGAPIVNADFPILPAVDPVMEMGSYMTQAKSERDDLAREYLKRWNDDGIVRNGSKGYGYNGDFEDKLARFDEWGRISQFANLWRIFTRGYLDQLLNEEFPDSNLPFQIRYNPVAVGSVDTILESEYMLVGVVYREGMNEAMPGVFNSPVDTVNQAYAQAFFFIPRRRIIYQENSSLTFLRSGLTRQDWREGPIRDRFGRIINTGWGTVGINSEWYPDRWDLLSQNWTMQLTPATAPGLPTILSTPPDIDGFDAETADFAGLSTEDVYWLSNH